MPESNALQLFDRSRWKSDDDDDGMGQFGMYELVLEALVPPKGL